MVMQNFDPAVAARVWQRVQAAQEKNCKEKLACPLEGIRTVPAVATVQEKTRPCKQVRKQASCAEVPLWLIILLLCM